jgi:hypothetical protein
LRATASYVCRRLLGRYKTFLRSIDGREKEFFL